MSVEQARKVPELKLYAKATNFFPGSLTWHYVYTFIRENGLTEDRIRTAAEQWELTGYQKTNVKGIFGMGAGWRAANAKKAAAPPTQRQSRRSAGIVERITWRPNKKSTPYLNFEHLTELPDHHARNPRPCTEHVFCRVR